VTTLALELFKERTNGVVLRRSSGPRITALTVQMPAGASLALASQGQRCAASASSRLRQRLPKASSPENGNSESCIEDCDRQRVCEPRGIGDYLGRKGAGSPAEPPR
jgi:hypothetical protein